MPLSGMVGGMARLSPGEGAARPVTGVPTVVSHQATHPPKAWGAVASGEQQEAEREAPREGCAGSLR